MIAQWLSEMGSESAALLILLVAGHIFGDFLLQTQWMAREKERGWGAMLAHVATVFVAQCVVLWPFLSGRLVVAVLGLSVVHLLFDATRSAVREGVGQMTVDEVLYTRQGDIRVHSSGDKAA